MQDLRDKLLKAGLVTEGDAKRVETDRRRPPPSTRPRAEHPPARGPRPSSGAPIPKLPPLPVANNKEFQRLEAKKQLELDRRIRELVQGAQLEVPVGAHTFFFVTRKNRLRRLEMTPEFAAKLEGGEVAVVERPDPGQIEHAVVPAAVADELLGLNERTVRFYNRKEAPVGFITDDELAQRQKDEAERPEPAEAAQATEAAGGEGSADTADAAGPGAAAAQDSARDETQS